MRTLIKLPYRVYRFLAVWWLTISLFIAMYRILTRMPKFDGDEDLGFGTPYPLTPVLTGLKELEPINPNDPPKLERNYFGPSIVALPYSKRWWGSEYQARPLVREAPVAPPVPPEPSYVEKKFGPVRHVSYESVDNCPACQLNRKAAGLSYNKNIIV